MPSTSSQPQAPVLPAQHEAPPYLGTWGIAMFCLFFPLNQAGPWFTARWDLGLPPGLWLEAACPFISGTWKLSEIRRMSHLEGGALACRWLGEALQRSLPALCSLCFHEGL